MSRRKKRRRPLLDRKSTELTTSVASGVFFASCPICAFAVLRGIKIERARGDEGTGAVLGV